MARWSSVPTICLHSGFVAVSTWNPTLASAFCDVWPLVSVCSLAFACRAFDGFQNVAPTTQPVTTTMEEPLTEAAFKARPTALGFARELK